MPFRAHSRWLFSVLTFVQHIEMQGALSRPYNSDDMKFLSEFYFMTSFIPTFNRYIY